MVRKSTTITRASPALALSLRIDLHSHTSSPCDWGASLPTLSKEGGSGEAPPGGKAEADRVCEGISEGFRLAETGRVVPGGAEAVSLWLLGIGEFESTGSLEARACS